MQKEADWDRDRETAHTWFTRDREDIHLSKRQKEKRSKKTEKANIYIDTGIYTLIHT